MATHLVLDAMIRRADFWEGGKERAESAQQTESITFENLRSDSLFTLNLRKPDFQRETNQWTTSQAVNFIQSFIDGDLVPSIILWLSPEGYNFVIDGAHRLSALRAWVQDDYGDGPDSLAFFGGDIPNDQRNAARRMRATVEKQIGSFKQLRDMIQARAARPDVQYPDIVNKRLRHIGSRRLDVQWVGGDADVAETSFFKINTQGTPLDKTEEDLLRNRQRAAAIAARSIVRAATGHKYWSRFEEPVRKQIENLAQKLNLLLFQPEFETPIRTMYLPIGGRSSNLDALGVLVRLISFTDAGAGLKKTSLSDSPIDGDGQETIKTLHNCLRVAERITGRDRASLGLHPYVYFYSDRGKYLPEMFLGMAALIKSHLLNNNDGFFKKFTTARSQMEEFLLANKALVSQMLQQIQSRQRPERVADMLGYLINTATAGQPLTIEGMAGAAKLKGSIVALQEKVEGQKFSEAASSSIFLREAQKTLLKCPLCNGYMEPSLSASLDHIKRRSEGGTGDSDNGQLTHFFCNTGVKN